MKKIEIEVTDETFTKITMLKGVLTQNNKKDYTEQDIVKGALAFYLNRFYHTQDHDYSVEELIPLASLGEVQNNVKQLIDELNVQASDLASEIKASRSVMSKILNNKQQPSLDLFIRIWVALGKPPVEKLLYRVKNSQDNQEESHTS